MFMLFYFLIMVAKVYDIIIPLLRDWWLWAQNILIPQSFFIVLFMIHFIHNNFFGRDCINEALEIAPNRLRRHKMTRSFLFIRSLIKLILCSIKTMPLNLKRIFMLLLFHNFTFPLSQTSTIPYPFPYFILFFNFIFLLQCELGSRCSSKYVKSRSLHMYRTVRKNMLKVEARLVVSIKISGNKMDLFYQIID